MHAISSRMKNRNGFSSTYADKHTEFTDVGKRSNAAYRHLDDVDLALLKERKENELIELNRYLLICSNSCSQIMASIDDLAYNHDGLKLKFRNLERKKIELQNKHREDIAKLESDFKRWDVERGNKLVDSLQEIQNECLQKVEQIHIERETKFQSQISELKSTLYLLDKENVYLSSKALKEEKNKIKNAYEEKTIEDSESYKLKIKESIITKNKLKIEIENMKAIIKLNQSNDVELCKEIYNLESDLKNVHQMENKVAKDLSVKKQQVTKIQQLLDEECSSLNQLKTTVDSYTKQMLQFDEMLLEEESRRRVCHDQLQQLKGNIRVFCRIKPTVSQTFNFNISPILETVDGKEHLKIVEPYNTLKRTNASPKKPRSYNFSFDKVFHENSTNGEIFDEVSQLIQSSLDGFNVCIFTYGQTGSGKTYTMSNPNDGLIPRSLFQIFNRVESLSARGWNYQLQGQFFEIYGDSVKDLIGNSADSIKFNAMDIEHVCKVQLDDVEQINKYLNTASSQRSTASTKANDVSSRSHSIFRIIINGVDHNGTTLQGSLNLVDLAGSERISSSQVSGARLKETQAINKSLSALGDVISALQDQTKKRHIPYRNSKLTYLLKDSLSGQSKTLMFVNVSVEDEHFNETLNSLRFAGKVNETKMN
ncbi:Kar3 protein [Martiniozyma asiatica (nom. inval.)]|nr:Kar3 protein [Martiniozyma asiatica]